MGEDLELKDDQEYAIRNQTAEEIERLDSSEDVPKYRIKLDLDDDQIKRLTDGVFKEWEALKTQREDLGLAKKWEEADCLYKGEIKSSEKNSLKFNLHVHQAKIKEDAIVRALNEAFLDSDPLVDIAPRPEYARSGRDGIVSAQKKADFIDYAMDEEISPSKAFVLINHSAVRKFVGIRKLVWDYKREERKREETYKGTNQLVGVTPDGMPIVKNEGLEQFLRAYPDAPQKYPNYVKRLTEGKEAKIVVKYKDVISNNPRIIYIPINKFWVDNSTDYNEGLKSAHLIVEEQEYSWWELEEKEENEEFEDVIRLAQRTSSGSTEPTLDTDYKTAKYDVIECNYNFRLKEEDDCETKIKCWFGAENKVFLGAILWPYYSIDTDYRGFWVVLNDEGFYGGGRSVTLDLKDSNLAQDVLLSLAVHGVYVRNKITPIVREGSTMEAVFLEHNFREGDPISVDGLEDVSKSVGFVQWPNISLSDMLLLGQQLKRMDGDVTGVSDLMTGRESPNDPSAPATKTIALLNQSGINIKDYIRIYLPSFNELISDIFQLYYQMSDEEGRKFRIKRKSEGVTGQDVFADISRDEMCMKTLVQSRAASFAFDKINEKTENLAMYQAINANPYAIQQPKLLYQALVTLMKSWGPRWKTIAERDLVSPEQFQQQQMQIAMMAVQQLLQQAQQQAEITGVAPELQPEQLSGAVTQAQAVAFNPQLAQEGQ